MLKCGSCGHENEGTPKFCGKCGNPLTEPVSESIPAPIQTEQQPIQVEQPVPEAAAGAAFPALNAGSAKMLKIIVPAVIAVLLIAIVAIFVGGSSSGKTGDMSVFKSEDKTFIIATGGKVKTLNVIIDGIADISLDMNKAAFLADVDSENGGDLYYAAGSKKPVKAASGVYGYRLSDSGGGIAYITEYDRSAKTAVLNLYDTKSKKSSVIDKNLYFDGGRGRIILSPDGKTVFYQRYDAAAEEFTAYISVKGAKAEKFGERVYPVGVANGAKYIYYVENRDDNSAFYIKKGVKADKSKLGEADYNCCFFNRDYSQVIISTYDAAYVSVKGGEKIKITGGVSDILTADNILYRYNNDGNSYVYDLSGFKNAVYISGTDVYMMKGGKFEKTSVVKGVFNTRLTRDGKWLFYVDGSGNLKRASVKNTDADKLTVTKNFGNEYAITKDGNSVYYINKEKELFLKKATADGDGKKVDDDVNGKLVIADSGKAFYLKEFSNSSGGLLYSASGAKKKKIKEGVGELWSSGTSVFFSINMGDKYYDVYRSGGGNSFKKIVTDMT